MTWLRNILASDLMYHAVIAAIIVVAFYLFSRVVRGLLGIVGRRIFARTKTDLDDRILGIVLNNVKPLMIVTGLRIALSEVRKGASEADLTIHQLLDYGGEILYVVVVLLVVKIFLTILKEVVHWYLDRASAGGAVSLKLTLGPLTEKVAGIMVGLVAVIIILDHFGINIGSLLLSLGVGSLAVALAAQDTIANMIAGFVILVDRPFRVGDRIQLGSGEVGDVQEIGLRSTRILNFDANLLIVPNGELIKGRIINYSYPTHQTRVLLKFGVGYGTDPGKVRQVLLGLATAHPDILAHPAPEVQFTALMDSSMEFTLIARVTDYMKRGEVESELREEAYTALIKSGIEIPFPQRVVHMRSSS